MAKVNLTKGAKLAGIGRSTLNRHIKEGKISKAIGSDGKPYVDTSELQRVYGELSHDAASHTAPVTHIGTPQDIAEKSLELETLKVKLHAVEDRLQEVQADRDEWKGQAKTLSNLLTHQQPELPTKPKGMLARIAAAIKNSS